MRNCHSWNGSGSKMILYNVNDSKSTVDGNSKSEYVNGVNFQAFAVLQWRSLFFLGVPPHYWAIGAHCFKTV